MVNRSCEARFCSLLIANCRFSQRYVPVLLGRILGAFVLQHLERLNQLAARIARTNHRVEIAALGRDIRIGEAFAELLDLGSAIGIRIR